MKPMFKNLVTLFLISHDYLFHGSMAQEKKQNYGNIPDELVPYDKYHESI